MALYEYYCRACDLNFEQLVRWNSPDKGKCPKCKRKNNSERRISQFRVGGRGDLRESTLHGCHDCALPPGPGRVASDEEWKHRDDSHCDHSGHSDSDSIPEKSPEDVPKKKGA